LELLRIYYKSDRPTKYLFNGWKATDCYSAGAGRHAIIL